MFEVTCGICGASTRMKSTRDVYGDEDPFDVPVPYAATRETGWRSFADAYFCRTCYPTAAARADDWHAAQTVYRASVAKRLEAELATSMLAWYGRNPPPVFSTTIVAAPDV